MNYVTTDWKMRSNYECKSCPFSTLDEAVMQYHQDAAHPVYPTQGPSPDEWPAKLTSATVAEVPVETPAPVEVAPPVEAAPPVEVTPVADVAADAPAPDAPAVAADTTAVKSPRKGGF